MLILKASQRLTIGRRKIGVNGSVVVETAEELRVPYNMLGIVFPKGSLFREQGLHPLTAKVDPTWEGRLRVLLSNSGDSVRKLRRGMPIASVVFFSLEATLTEKLNFSKDNLPLVPRTRLQKAVSILDRPAVYTMAGAGVVAAATTLITTALIGG